MDDFADFAPKGDACSEQQGTKTRKHAYNYSRENEAKRHFHSAAYETHYPFDYSHYTTPCLRSNAVLIGLQNYQVKRPPYQILGGLLTLALILDAFASTPCRRCKLLSNAFPLFFKISTLGVSDLIFSCSSEEP